MRRRKYHFRAGRVYHFQDRAGERAEATSQAAPATDAAYPL